MGICKTNTRKRIVPSFYLQIFCVALCLFFLAGCTGYNPSMNKLDSLAFSANLKADVNVSYGKKAASSGGRIYYLSAESGVQGIHSMNTRGEEIMLEIPVEDIRAINILEDGIYYAGFVGIEENAAGPFRQFRLLTRKNDAADIVDFLEEAEYSDDLRDENVWDFYIADNGIVVIRFVEIAGYPGRTHFYFVSFRNGIAIQGSSYELVDDKSDIVYSTFNQYPLYLGRLDELYFLSYSFRNKAYLERESINFINALIDLNVEKNRIALSSERWQLDHINDYENHFSRRFCRGNANGLIFTSVHGLESYDFNTNAITDLVTFKSPESVYSQIDCGDSILVFTQQLRKNELWDSIAVNTLKLNRALGESLYRVNPETGDKKLILTLARNNSFLYADANTAVTGGSKTISIYDIATDTPVLLKTIELEHKIVDRANKVDTAGGWLFLYGFNEKTQRDELLEKVYIGS